VSPLSPETNEFHKRLLLFGVDYSKSARNEEPSSRGTLNSGLALVDSGVQLNLEIALSGVSAKVKLPQPAVQRGRECVGAPDHVINGFYVIRAIVSSPFSIYDAIGQVTKAEAKELTDFRKVCAAR